jgi:exoribonuclease R
MTKLTQTVQKGGCAAKVAASELHQILEKVTFPKAHPELLIDGLIHVTELGGDYYVFDEKRHSLMGKNSGFKYVAGQELDVIIANVDMERLFIDLELVELVE